MGFLSARDSSNSGYYSSCKNSYAKLTQRLWYKKIKARKLRGCAAFLSHFILVRGLQGNSRRDRVFTLRHLVQGVVTTKGYCSPACQMGGNRT